MLQSLTLNKFFWRSSSFPGIWIRLTCDLFENIALVRTALPIRERDRVRQAMKHQHTHPRGLVPTPQFRNKERKNWVGWRPAEVCNVFNPYRLLVNKRKGFCFINRDKILPHPGKILVIFSTTPSAKIISLSWKDIKKWPRSHSNGEGKLIFQWIDAHQVQSITWRQANVEDLHVQPENHSSFP